MINLKDLAKQNRKIFKQLEQYKFYLLLAKPSFSLNCG